MHSDEREDNTIYKVVVNHEERYSIWPADREIAFGWNDAGKCGTSAALRIQKSRAYTLKRGAK